VLLTGCSVMSNDNPTLFSGTRNYEMKIIKSEVNINDVKFTAKKNLVVKDALGQSGVEYTLDSREKLAKLDGVIATASREWNVYVDDIKSDLDSMVCNDCTVEWRYEMITN